MFDKKIRWAYSFSEGSHIFASEEGAIEKVRLFVDSNFDDIICSVGHTFHTIEIQNVYGWNQYLTFRASDYDTAGIYNFRPKIDKDIKEDNV